MSNAFNSTRRNTFANFNDVVEDDAGHFEQTFIKTKQRQPKQKHPMAGKKPQHFDKREYAYSLHSAAQ